MCVCVFVCLCVYLTSSLISSYQAHFIHLILLSHHITSFHITLGSKHSSVNNSLAEWRKKPISYSNEQITDIVRHMQTLSLLRPSDEKVAAEVESVQGQYLFSALQIAERLKQVDTAGVEPMHNPSESITAYLRDDTEITERVRTREEMMCNSSNTSDGYFVAPPTPASKTSS